MLFINDGQGEISPSKPQAATPAPRGRGTTRKIGWVCAARFPDGQIMNSQTSTKQTKVQQNKTRDRKTSESAENISTMKRIQNMYNVFSISSPEVSRKSLLLALSTHRASNIYGKNWVPGLKIT